MVRILVSLFFVSFLSFTFAGVTVYVYESDGQTLFDNRRIPVGTELKLVVVSDVNDLWSGGFFLSDQDSQMGLLYGDGMETDSRYCYDCRSSEVGDAAVVRAWDDTYIHGYDLYSDVNSVSGDWFTIDYIATGPGDPNIGIYDYDVSWNEPNNVITFNQVPGCDYDLNGRVDLSDFAAFSSYWGMHDNPAYDCNLVDLDGDSLLDLNDLIIFSSNWMWGSDRPDVNDIQPMPVADPNMIYKIVDANGLGEITVGVGDTIRLYVDLRTYGNSNTTFFDIEVLISDPNLGSIDNTAYDPDNPPGLGTARILADPNRWEFFDQWGPGIEQAEGIYFTALTDGTAMLDDHLASFVFTCEGPGDVTLYLINRISLDTERQEVYPVLKSILIHQPDNMSVDSAAVGSAAHPAEDISMTTEDIVQSLEEIRQNDTQIQEAIDDDKWNQFIDEVQSGDPL